MTPSTSEMIITATILQKNNKSSRIQERRLAQNGTDYSEPPIDEEDVTCLWSK